MTVQQDYESNTLSSKYVRSVLTFVLLLDFFLEFRGEVAARTLRSSVFISTRIAFKVRSSALTIYVDSPLRAFIEDTALPSVLRGPVVLSQSLHTLIAKA